MIIGAIVLLLIIIGIGIFAVLPGIESANAQHQATPTPIVQSSATSTRKSYGIAKILKQYASEIKTQVAQGLHLSPQQLTTDLKGGKTLSEVATAQNISTTQLQTVIANALTGGLQPAVSDGSLTQQQVNKLVKKYQNNPALLDHLFGGKAVSQGTPTPTPTPTPGQ